MDIKEKKLLRYLLLLFLGLTLGIGWLSEFIMHSYPLSPYRIGLRIVFILGDLLLLARILHLLLLRAQLSTRRQRWTMALGGFFFIVLLMEIPFMFIPYSHGNGNTYASRIWFNRYWQENSLGFRDPEPVPPEGKTKVFFLGDSFVAGHGIEDPGERFSNLVADSLGHPYVVYNLGRNGADTREELKNLQNFPFPPDIVVLSHIPNDIERVQAGKGKLGLRRDSRQGQVTPQLPKVEAGLDFLSFLSRGSFFLNYTFWKFNGFFEGNMAPRIQKSPADFHGNHVAMFFEETALHAHHADLQKLLDHCQAQGSKLLVLAFPETYEAGIDFTQQAINLPLEKWLAERDVPTVHAYEVLRPLPEADRIVNYNDVHPSVLANRAVAGLVLKKLRELGWTAQPQGP